ncbi:DNA alkylation repair protein [archaeon]|jgi:3-methyladenine DNA glycosylase AlkD|nr:DNA alkylation repair protein [archaeon]MBT3451203.1 DNA alkylation repair protein [archaeon]MBT6869769.1 DNA alkylation repair protein [archaeon]MBT7192724.1 DNA alkylation repair protein [archaeon]MBT7380749.1 DNA alkylation repair protein [archaeon]
MLNQIKQDLNNLADKELSKNYSRFFKTGKGEYGEGDIFLGMRVPKLREVAKRYYEMNLTDLVKLLQTNIHEYRLGALIILVNKYKKAKKNNNDLEQRKIVNLYLDNTKYINNWDLVDSSAHYILGEYLLEKENLKDRKILYDLAKSKDLWERRISVISTFAFIRNNQFEDSLKISKILLYDHHDLIHKAVGWMLREIGKRNQEVEEKFLKQHYKTMPRTMLRYAIEKFEENKRQWYLKK